MKTYLLTAAGVIFLSVIVSLLIPEGKLNKSIVFVMRLACIFVLIQPITGIFKIKSSTVRFIPIIRANSLKSLSPKSFLRPATVLWILSSITVNLR